jgi:glycosyltransferase involved in cell wall biosynthesis
MKVLNVNTHLDPITGGGTAERTIQMSKYLVKAGIECTILTTDLGLTPDRIRSLDGVNIIGLPCINRRFYIPKFSYTMVKSIVENVDIVHLMNHWSLINTFVYWVAQRLKKPYVICPAGVLLVYGRSKVIKTIYNWMIGKRIIRKAAGHIAITADEIPQFQTYGVEREKIAVIPNGINPKEFEDNNVKEFRTKYGLGEAPFILFMGRLNPAKGPDLLLSAFCNVSELLASYHLVFAGPDQDMLNSLKKIVSKHDLENRVHFLGFLGGADKSRAYVAAELLVIPSRREAMSIVVLEAGITGTPVLITDKCGFNQVEAIGGGIVVSASVEGLQRGLVQILGDPVDLRRKGERLKDFTTRNFLWESIVNRHVQLYKKILAKPVQL